MVWCLLSAVLHNMKTEYDKVKCQLSIIFMTNNHNQDTELMTPNFIHEVLDLKFDKEREIQRADYDNGIQ